MTTQASRREFLRQASALSIAGTAAPFALNLASIGAASAQVAGGYKALVCVFLYGANDGHNTDRAFDTPSYATTQPPRARIAPSTELPIDSATPLPGGLQLSVPTHWHRSQPCGIGEVAVVANVGPLIQPTTRAH